MNGNESIAKGQWDLDHSFSLQHNPVLQIPRRWLQTPLLKGAGKLAHARHTQSCPHKLWLSPAVCSLRSTATLSGERRREGWGNWKGKQQGKKKEIRREGKAGTEKEHEQEEKGRAGVSEMRVHLSPRALLLLRLDQLQWTWPALQIASKWACPLIVRSYLLESIKLEGFQKVVKKTGPKDRMLRQQKRSKP